MYLGFFDRKILDVLNRKSEPVTLAELVGDYGFARSTVIFHLERLGTEELILKEKKPRKDHERPEFLYRPADAPQPKTAPQPSVIVMEFSKLKKACSARMKTLWTKKTFDYANFVTKYNLEQLMAMLKSP